MVVTMAQQRRKHSKAFKAEVVRLVLEGGKSPSEVARAHELAASLVFNWLKQAKVDQGLGAPGAYSTLEKQELAQLRREIRDLRMERDFFKKCSTWLVRQNT